jgi:hypothetical protein
MAIDFRGGSVDFDPTQGMIQTQRGTVVFPNGSVVTRADVAIKSFNMQYNNGDHHVLREMIRASVDSIQANTVEFKVDFLLRDDSGNIDDPFSGSVDVLVVADLAPPRNGQPSTATRRAVATTANGGRDERAG